MQANLIEQIKKLNKDYYTISDLAKILNLGKASVYVAMNRLVRQGWFIRVAKGIYVLKNSSINQKTIANQIYQPSYLSFESALSEYGILNQIPYDLTFATNRMPKKMVLAGSKIEFRKLAQKYFFSYQLKEGIYIATPEKALIDQLYLTSLGCAKLDFGELNLKSLSKIKFQQILKRFPLKTKKLATKVLASFGSNSVTIR